MTLAFVIAVSVILGLLLFLIREARRPPGPSQWPKRLRVLLDAVIWLLSLFLFWGFFIEPGRLVVHREDIQLTNWPTELSGLRVAVLSDIHVDRWFVDENKLRSIVQRTNEVQPDVIVILGDYMSNNGLVRRETEPQVFAPILKELRAPLGVYSVLGNHDWWYDGDKVREALEQNGIRILENDVVQLSARNRSMWIAGLSDLWTQPQKIDETIAKVPEGEPVIALSHNPDIFPNLPRRVPLLLAGHTHGGQVRFPLIGAVVESTRYGERYERGLVFENSHHLFVSSGIGTSIMPVRFGVTPEIVLLTLNSN